MNEQPSSDAAALAVERDYARRERDAWKKCVAARTDDLAVATNERDVARSELEALVAAALALNLQECIYVIGAHPNYFEAEIPRAELKAFLAALSVAAGAAA